MPGRPTVLVLTHEPPLPAVSGGRVRSLGLIRELVRRGWGVSLFSLVPGEPVSKRDREELESLCDVAELVPLGRGRLAGYGSILLAAALRRAFQEVYFLSRRARDEVGKLLAAGDFDAILAGQLYMYPYVPPARRRETVLDCHNVELQRVERMADVLWPRPRGVVARLQRGPVRRYEERAVASVAGALAVSEADRAHLEAISPGRVELVPNGVDCERIRPRDSLPDSGVLFLGAMDYGANADGLLHLVADVLPRVRTPVTVTVAGGNPPRSVIRAAARSPSEVRVLGRVESTAPCFERNRILVVPLRLGGGTRLKVLESLARGVPVVTTSLGCEGLGLTHGREAIVADRPDEFAAWIDRLLGDDELCRALARNGRELVERRFDWRRIGGSLDAAIRRLVGR